MDKLVASKCIPTRERGNENLPTYTDMLRKDIPITIIADDREQKSGVIQSLATIQNITVRIQRLSLGDYKIDRRLIVERKTLKDFAISIIDGRLFKQMILVANSDFMKALIIEGVTKDLSEIGMKRESMQGALITISLIMGIPVLRSMDTFETAKLIVYMARQLRSVTRRGINRSGYRPKDKRKRQLFILQGLPGIGLDRAGRLLDKFGSVEAVISASSVELQEVHGIGKGIADKIKRAVS
jgi:DNA excision repair protein ERCC-4